jgi:flagellar hook-length control protein FliK
MNSINPTESVINSISNFSEKSKVIQDPNEKSFSSLLDEHLTTADDYNATATSLSRNPTATTASSNDSSISNALTSENEQNYSISTTTNALEKPSITVKDKLTTEKKALVSQEENNSINPNLQAELLIANNNFTNYNPELKQAIKESSLASTPVGTQNIETLLKTSSTTQNTIASDISTSGNDQKLPKPAVDLKERSIGSKPVATQNVDTLLKTSSNSQNTIASDMSTSGNDLKLPKPAESSLGSAPVAILNVDTLLKTSSNSQNTIASDMSTSGKELNTPLSATLLNNVSFENKIVTDISNPPISNNLSTTNYQINTNLYQSGWNEAFNQRVIFMTHNNINSASISINPEHLGPIQVQLQMDANQQTSIHFIANNPEVRQIITDSIQQLGELLDQSGIQLGQTSVGSQNRNQKGKEQNTPHQSLNDMNQTIDTDTDTSSNISTITKQGLINTSV